MGKASRAMLPTYTNFVDVFLKDPYATYFVMTVHRGINWRRWESTEEKRFFKTYYLFLRRLMFPSSRYRILCDDKSTQKYYSWSSLGMHFIMHLRGII
jgi:hypothetical protein